MLSCETALELPFRRISDKIAEPEDFFIEFFAREDFNFASRLVVDRKEVQAPFSLWVAEHGGRRNLNNRIPELHIKKVCFKIFIRPELFGNLKNTRVR